MATAFSMAQLSSLLVHPAERVMEQIGRVLGVEVTVESEHVDAQPEQHVARDLGSSVGAIRSSHTLIGERREQVRSEREPNDVQPSKGTSGPAAIAPMVLVDRAEPAPIAHLGAESRQRTASRSDDSSSISTSSPRRPTIRVVPPTPSAAALAPRILDEASSASSPATRQPLVVAAPNAPSAKLEAPPPAKPSTGPHPLPASVERAPHGLPPVLLDAPRIPDEPRKAPAAPQRKRLVFAAPNEAAPKLEAPPPALPSPVPHASPAPVERALRNSSPASDDDAQPANVASSPRPRPMIRPVPSAPRASVLEPATSPQRTPVDVPSPAGRKQLRFAPPADATAPALDIPLPLVPARAHSVPLAPVTALRATSGLSAGSGDERRNTADAPSATSSAETTVAAPPTATAPPAVDTNNAGARLAAAGQIDRYELEELLVDVLRDAARRHGLEV